MQRRGTTRVLLGVMLTISLAAMGAWAQTAPAKAKLERLKIAVAPLGWDTNITWRKGIQFHDNWGEFTARDVRHAVFLISQPESVQTDTGFWRSVMGIGKNDSIEDVAKK